MSAVPTYVFLTRGRGCHAEKLTSFELALRAAYIAPFNLVKVSSILPPRCRIVPLRVGLGMLSPGQIVHCVMARSETREPGRLVAAGIGVARPRDQDRYGYISEHHDFGQKARRVADYAEDLAATMLATTLGVEFDADADYDERKEVYRMSGQIVDSRSIVQTAKGHKDGKWTTVVAAVVFMM